MKLKNKLYFFLVCVAAYYNIINHNNLNKIEKYVYTYYDYRSDYNNDVKITKLILLLICKRQNRIVAEGGTNG